MPIHKKTAFSRRLPDLVTEELASVLSSRSNYEFKDIFALVHANLKARNAASGGEEMLRLRAYEKLQNLVARGMVKKEGKKYKGIPKQLATLETFPPAPGAPIISGAKVVPVVPAAPVVKASPVAKPAPAAKARPSAKTPSKPATKAKPASRSKSLSVAA